LQRFQRVFPALEDPNSQWADKAIDCGYYDQAHLIRDFKEFAGKPPLALLAAEIDLSRRFVRSASMSDFSNTAVRTSH
jgi:methylphosphotriester-DNA--protein-cysteine methyltransferase